MKKICAIIVTLLSLTYASDTMEKAPNFTLKTLKGKNYTLAKNMDGIKVVNFWATWCVPCIGEMDELKKLHSIYAEKGVEFIAISVDDNKSSGKVPAIVRSRKLPFTVLLDPEKVAYKKNHVSNVPTLMVINEKQEVVYKHTGFTPGDEEHLEEVIQKALQAQGK